jgi:large subunit ribosomal protein L3
MKALIGKKIGMTQAFDEFGRVVPLTVIEAGPCVVVQRKTEKLDGYSAVQMAFGKKKRPNKPLSGHFKRAGFEEVGRVLREFRVVDESSSPAMGSTVTVSVFAPGDRVKVTGRSKGRGFAGSGKRWGFSGGNETHGCKSHRTPGSMGCASTPSRTFRGRRLPGRMGNARVTVRNLTVHGVDEERNLVLIRGAVPGARNTLVTIRGGDN